MTKPHHSHHPSFVDEPSELDLEITIDDLFDLEDTLARSFSPQDDEERLADDVTRQFLRRADTYFTHAEAELLRSVLADELLAMPSGRRRLAALCAIIRKRR